MQFLLMQVFGQRMNILMADFLMHLAIYAFSMFITALYVVTKLHNNDPDILQLGVVLIFGVLVFVACRGDFFVHRSAAYERYVEERLPAEWKVNNPKDNVSNIMTYEEWKSRRTNTWMVGAMDAVAGLYLLFLLIKLQTPLWHSGNHTFVIVSSMLIACAAYYLALVPKLAGR